MHLVGLSNLECAFRGFRVTDKVVEFALSRLDCVTKARTLPGPLVQY